MGGGGVQKRDSKVHNAFCAFCTPLEERFEGLNPLFCMCLRSHSSKNVCVSLGALEVTGSSLRGAALSVQPPVCQSLSPMHRQISLFPCVSLFRRSLIDCARCWNAEYPHVFVRCMLLWAVTTATPWSQSDGSQSRRQGELHRTKTQKAPQLYPSLSRAQELGGLEQSHKFEKYLPFRGSFVRPGNNPAIPKTTTSS